LQGTEDAQGKRFKSGAVVLLLLAWALPFLLIVDYTQQAGEISDLLAGVLVASLATFGVTWLIFRKGSVQEKCKAMLVAAVLVLGWSGYQSVDLRHKTLALKAAASNLKDSLQFIEPTPVSQTGHTLGPQTTAPIAILPPAPAAVDTKVALAHFLNAMAEVRRKHATQEQDLNKRMDALDMSGMLSPGNLVEAAALTRSREMLADYTAMIVESKQLFDSMAAENKSVLLASELTEQQKQTSLAHFDTSSQQSRKLLADLESAGLNLVDASKKILDLCQQGLGQIQAQGNTLVFRT
jgi:hypothetical protein